MIKVILTPVSFFFRSPVRRQTADGHSRKGGGKSSSSHLLQSKWTLQQTAILVSAWEQKDCTLEGKEGDEEGNGSLASSTHAPRPEMRQFSLIYC